MMFYFYIPEGICFAVFVAFSCTWLYLARFHLWGGLNMTYYYLLLLMLPFCSIIVYMLQLTLELQRHRGQQPYIQNTTRNKQQIATQNRQTTIKGKQASTHIRIRKLTEKNTTEKHK
jgi:hypothetical protein